MNDILNHKVSFQLSAFETNQCHIQLLYTIDADCCFLLQLREYCLRLRNMVASEATKAELSDAVDTMIEEVSWIIMYGKNFIPTV